MIGSFLQQSTISGYVCSVNLSKPGRGHIIIFLLPKMFFLCCDTKRRFVIFPEYILFWF